LKVVLEQDPVPIVKIIGARVKRALATPAVANIARELRGCFALASTTDPQSLTIHLDGETVRLCRGIDMLALIVIHLDFNSDSKPRIENLWRHPKFALKVAKLLEPEHVPWIDAARQFWQLAHDYPGLPGSMTLQCTDQDRTLTLYYDLEEPRAAATAQGPDPDNIEIHGTARVLSELFSGDKVLLEAAMKGDVRLFGNLKHAAALTSLTLQHLLGELNGPAAHKKQSNPVPQPAGPDHGHL
jgi:hypothetical protein